LELGTAPGTLTAERMTYPTMTDQTLHGDPPSSSVPYRSLALWLLAFVLFYGPTYVVLMRDTWSTDDQGHGPMIIAASAFLLWQRRNLIFAGEARPAVGAAIVMMLVSMVFYAIGHSQSVIELEAISQIPVLASVLLLTHGWSALRRAWFPLSFLLFSVPIPGAVTQMITMPLKLAVSTVANEVLYWAGYPIGRVGVMLTVGQYQLLVADACSGLNSLFTLEALGLLYMNVMNYTNRTRNTLLAVMIIPISFISNVTRVITLVLLTYYYGDEVGQGFAHNFSGMVLFGVALVLTYAFDQLLSIWFDKKKAGKA
jgi:exosortase B